jgi:hypothetical protein
MWCEFLIFAKVFMKKLILFSSLMMIGCAQNNQAHPPVGGILSQEDLNISKNRAKKFKPNRTNSNSGLDQ